MDVQIIDDFLSPNDFHNLQEVMLGLEFPWFYVPGKSSPRENQLNKKVFQFGHVFYSEYSWRSQYGGLLDPILQLLNPVAIFRIKANLTTITDTKIQYDYHRDTGSMTLKSKTACFYINTNNGHTVLSTGQEINSVANRIAIFDSSLWHAGTSCTDESIRVMINLNYFTSSI